MPFKQYWAPSLLVVGILLASLVQTNFGRVTVKDTRFIGSNGSLMSGLLYIPQGTTVNRPAPAILAIHGYINSRETQSAFAIELARRGYVVLALDQTGHGYSDAPAFSNGFGGPDGLKYLRSLPFVDQTRIGMEGHSMGGWAIQAAAATTPDAYQSMVLTGSSTGTLGVPEGTAEYPRNLLLVFSLFDEFSELMWGAAVPADIVETAKLKTLFDTDETVISGRLYGDVKSGNARMLRMPAVTHPGDHLSVDTVAATVAWFSKTLQSPTLLQDRDQIWFWKELATLLALLGFAGTSLLLINRFITVTDLEQHQPQLSQKLEQVTLLIAVVAPVILFFPLQDIANLVLPAMAVLPQQITNGVLLWAWGSGLVTLAWLFFCRSRASGELFRIAKPNLLLPALRSALIVCSVLYAVAASAQFLFSVDFRFWVVALKPLSSQQFFIFLCYLPLFTVFFGVMSLGLHGFRSQRSAMQNGTLLSAGFMVLLAMQYTPLLLGGTLLLASQPLLTIVAFQFVPILFFVGIISTRCFNRTGNIWAGTIINSLLVTWYLTAGTATQVLPVFG